MDLPGIDIVESGGLDQNADQNGRPADAGPDPSNLASGRPALQVYFKCANAYLRVLRSADGARYQARCPKCSKEIRFAVGEGGSSKRFFEVSC